MCTACAKPLNYVKPAAPSSVGETRKKAIWEVGATALVGTGRGDGDNGVSALGDLIIVIATIGVVGLAFYGLCHLGIFCLVRRMEDRPAPDIRSLFGEEAARHDRLLVYFFGERCRACENVTPVVDQLAKRHRNVVKVDAGIRPEIAHEFAILGTPTLVLVDQDRIAKVLVGSPSPKRIRALLEPAMGADPVNRDRQSAAARTQAHHSSDC